MDDEHWITIPLVEFEELKEQLREAEQERDDKQIVIDAKLALEAHLYERIHAAEARVVALETMLREMHDEKCGCQIAPVIEWCSWQIAISTHKYD